jgi:hypothetical protein
MSPAHALRFAIALFSAHFVLPVATPQQSHAAKVHQITGLVGVKDNAKGSLSVEGDHLHFARGNQTADVAATSVQDVVTGADTEKAIGKTIGLLSMAAPYESGRFLSLFRKKIDTLTIKSRDSDGALHGAIFTMHVGAAEELKKELLAQGAHSVAPEAEAVPPVAANSSEKSNVQPSIASTPVQSNQPVPVKIKASAIQVEMIQSDEIKLPSEFQVALYEKLIQQLQKRGGFQRIFRDGDRNASDVPGLVILHSNVSGFKAGSERAREVTTVFGWTSIKVHCRFTNPDGATLLERDVSGKVRFFGGNLRATYDFAKKTARVTRENFSSPATGQ